MYSHKKVAGLWLQLHNGKYISNGVFDGSKTISENITEACKQNKIMNLSPVVNCIIAHSLQSNWPVIQFTDINKIIKSNKFVCIIIDDRFRTVLFPNCLTDLRSVLAKMKLPLNYKFKTIMAYKINISIVKMSRLF